MRRDVGFYLEADVKSVYEAYLMAAMNKPFERDCRQEPYHTIGFGVNYSFKYNMNGGSCTIHFMPYASGTAVNMRFSIAQAAGARYERYAADLNDAMQNFLPVTPQPASYDMDDFLKSQNQVTPAAFRVPTPVTQPIQQSQPQPAARSGSMQFCANCGNQLVPGGRFCTRCGKAVSAGKSCPSCHTPAAPNASFCANCGTRL